MEINQEKFHLGKPQKYSSVDEFEIKCSEYFEMQYQKNKPVGICGLAAYLGIDRTTLNRWEKKYPDTFGVVIRKTKAEIEAYLEMCLYGRNVTGTIFNLKNNFGWAEREKVENVNVEMSYEDYIKKMESCATNEEY